MENKSTADFRFKLSALVAIWVVAFAILCVLYTLSFVGGNVVRAETYWITQIFVTFATFTITSFFSYSLVRQSDIINKQNRQNNDEVNARSESFRTLQFIASNYAAVDFVDHMLIYEIYKSYISDLRKTRNLRFYMREEDITNEDILDDMGNFMFLTVRIPIQPISDRAPISSIKFSNFNFYKEENTEHCFVACLENCTRNALVLYDKNERRQEVVINLVVKKTSDFWTHDAVNPFLKITFNHSMNSLLGVVVSGWTQLYFVNPQKLERGGANKYTINSSQFEISGLPKLSQNVEKDIIEQTHAD